MSKSPATARLSLSVRLGVTAAAAVLLTAGCLSPLVEGHRWMIDVLVVVATVSGTGLIARELTRWRAPVVLAQLLALFVVTTVLFARDNAAAGVLPSPAAWQQLRLLADQGVDVTREQAPPVDAASGVLLLIAVGIGLVAVVTDATAATWRRPALAGLPLLAVYCVPAAVLADGLSWTWFLLAACGFMLLVAADSADRVRAWGRVVTPAADEERGRFGILPGSSGVRAGALAVAAALIVPLALPALGDPLIKGTGLGDGNGTGRGKGRYANPILDLRHNLTARSNDVALRLRTTSDRGAPRLRIAVDDQFDGTTWSPSTEVPPAANQVGRGMPAVPGLDSTIATTPAEAQIQIESLDQSFLPLPYPATRVNVAGDWRVNSATLDVVGRGVRTAGLSYSAQYLELNPSSQDLLNASVADMIALQPYLQARDVPESIKEKAKEIAGVGSPLEQAKRIQDWLRNTFQYSVEAPLGDGPNDASYAVMEQFLEQRRGYCVHFASAMAVMSRVVGIPARVAVGFLPPGRGEDGSYAYTYARLHAWPELYFRGVGWIWFEPTPATQAGVPPSWTIIGDGQKPVIPVPAITTSRPGSNVTGSRAPETEQTDGPARSGHGVGVGDWWLLALLLPLAVMLAVLPRLVVLTRRRRRWGRARTPVDLAETAWSMLAVALGDLGSTWPGSATPRQVRQLLVDRHDLSVREEASLGRLVADLEAARYAPPEAGPDVGRTVAQRRSDVDAVRSAVAARLDRRRRWRAAWLPSLRGPMVAEAEEATKVGRDVEETDRTPVSAGAARR